MTIHFTKSFTFRTADGTLHNLRVVRIAGAPWLVGSDVCRVLGWTEGGRYGGTSHRLHALRDNERQTVYRRDPACWMLFTAACNESPKGTVASSLVLISLGGLDRLVGMKASPHGAPFRAWVASILAPEQAAA